MKALLTCLWTQWLTARLPDIRIVAPRGDIWVAASDVPCSAGFLTGCALAVTIDWVGNVLVLAPEEVIWRWGFMESEGEGNNQEGGDEPERG